MEPHGVIVREIAGVAIVEARVSGATASVPVATSVLNSRSVLPAASLHPETCTA